MDRRYDAHESLVGPVRARPEIWRLLAGLAVIAVVVFGLNAALMSAILGWAPAGQFPDFLAGSTPIAMLILLGSFSFVTLGVLIAARKIQNRPLASVLGQYRPCAVQFWQVSRALLVLSVVIVALPPYDMGGPLTPNLAPSLWLALLPLSMLAVLIQTSAEEILFRGYLQQSLAARFRSPVIWMGLPALLFALGHYVPAEAGENASLVALWSGAFGLLMADLTARAGTLGPAMALHFFNNFVALLIFALPGGLSGLALYHLPYEISDTEQLRAWLLVDFALMVVGWLVARIALRR